MSEIRFEDQADEFGRPPENPSGLDFVQMLVKRGIAADRQQAEYILIGVAVVSLVVAFFVWRWSGRAAHLAPQWKVDAAFQESAALRNMMTNPPAQP